MKSLRMLCAATPLVLAAFAAVPTYADPLDDLFYPADSNGLLPIERMIEQTRASVPGTILEVELEHEHGKLVYEVEVLTADNKKVEIEYDARTGAELSREIKKGKAR